MSYREQELRAVVKEVLGVAFGEVSMCWSETPKGVFDSSRAETILNEVAEDLYKAFTNAERVTAKEE